MSSNVWAGLKEKFKNSERCVEASCGDKSSFPGDEDSLDPPDRADIGRAAWRYLHSLAAHHPEDPTEQQQSNATAWLASFVQFYPCAHCAEHFVDVCETNPPRVSSRSDYALWWCEAHNTVNEHLTVEPKSCDASKLIKMGLAGKTLDELLLGSSAATPE
mmetsp:Transcript_61868/g.135315  ORF Transcript_61868/g.135315 Transcript_61868/m.135315 type:complete len:160 (+) Transcript_61868:65-544(+)